MLVLLLVFTSFNRAAERLPVPPAEPPSAAAAPVEETTLAEAEAAAKKLRAAPGLRIELFAAEPLVQNIVNFAFDSAGRAYVIETFRRRSSVPDIRFHPDWLESDLSLRSVAARSNFLSNAIMSGTAHVLDLNGDGRTDAKDLSVESERIRLLTDTNKDGRADRVTTFAEGFNSSVSGVAAGILPRDSGVYFACIPDLWLLRDHDGDGISDSRKLLHTGFGVHIGLGGHDLHGLALGPDGKVYFTFGDRGAHVEEEGRLLVDLPDTGGVLRCNLDGSDLEVFAFGLRNPQELAFDQFGNLWTADNNADGGDKARWVYVVEGGNSGWTVGWQWLPKLGAWNSEKLWGLAADNTAAYIVPPISHIGHGPAGLAYYPGTGMPDSFTNHFFLADFPGGIRMFTVKPSGAAYTVDNPREYLQDNSQEKMEGKLVWGFYPVDVGFGPDGAAYVADWVEGWEKTGKGRIYRISDPVLARNGLGKETALHLQQGFGHRPLDELGRLLAHPDLRVRQEAQFALAERGAEAAPTLVQIAIKNESLLARCHAVWGLGQIGRKQRTFLDPLLPLLVDAEPEIRAQAAKVLGDSRYVAAFNGLMNHLHDASPRVRFFAAIGLGKLGRKQAVPALLEMLRANADEDRYIRHAGVMALTGIGDVELLVAASRDASASVRMASLLALRRLRRPEVAELLNDTDPALVLEAARAIHDVPIAPALPRLALLAGDIPRLTSQFSPREASSRPDAPAEEPLPRLAPKPVPALDPVLRRSLNANFRLGLEVNAAALVQVAANGAAPTALREEALQLLSDWARPPARDRITGLWRPIPERDQEVAVAALRPIVQRLQADAPDSVRSLALRLAEQFGLGASTSGLFDMVADVQLAPDVRIEALRALADRVDPQLNNAIPIALADKNRSLRLEAVRLLPKLKPGLATRHIATILEKGSVPEKQLAFDLLGNLDVSVADSILSEWLDKLLAGSLPPELLLNLLEAASKRPQAGLQEKLARFETARPKGDPLRGYRELLAGGSIEAGRNIFIEQAQAACLRCHKIKTEGGEVGPDLTGIGSRQSREYILESILYPNRQIAKGYETLVITLRNGLSYAGQLIKEDEKDLVINSPEDGLVKVPKDDIKYRKAGLSAMPPEIEKILSRRDIRNLVEFLAAQN